MSTKFTKTENLAFVVTRSNMTNLLVEYARFYGSLKSLIDHVENKLISNEDMIESVKQMMVKFERERNRMSKRNELNEKEVK